MPCAAQCRHQNRWTLYVSAFVVCSLVSGLVYGWPALRQHLRGDGSTLSERQFGAAFTAGSWSTQGCRFLTGMARDRFGTRVVASFCLLSAACGVLGIGLLDSNDPMSLAVSLFVVGLGSGVQLTLQPVAKLFPDHAGSVLSSLSGAFQVSGLVFLTLSSLRLPRSVSYSGFSCLLLLTSVIALVILPEGVHFDDEVDDSLPSDVEEHEIVDPDDGEQDVAGTTCAADDSAVSGNCERQIGTTSAWLQIRSLEYILLLGWFSINVTPHQYYVGSIGFQLEEKGDASGFYTDLYTILYGSAAALSPVAGLLADRLGVSVAEGTATMLSAASLFILSSKRMTLDSQIVGLIANSLGRMITWGSYFAHLGKRFGYRNFGTLGGLGLLVSAIVSLIQYPLIALASDGRSSVVNQACAAGLLATLPYCVWLYVREKRGSAELTGKV